MDGEEERLVETNDRGRRIVGPPGGGPLLRIFGLAALNGCGDVGSAHLVCIRSCRFGGVGRLGQRIGWAAWVGGLKQQGRLGSAHLVWAALAGWDGAFNRRLPLTNLLFITSRRAWPASAAPNPV
jgi:hypothetical protein